MISGSAQTRRLRGFLYPLDYWRGISPRCTLSDSATNRQLGFVNATPLLSGDQPHFSKPDLQLTWTATWPN